MDIQISHIIIGSAALIIIFLLILLLHAVSSSSKDKLSELQQKLGAIETAALQMQEIGKEVSSLKSILHAPKIRGNFGEYLLYNLLKDCLPPKNFTTQYHFSDGSAVDAAIRLGKYIVPVDSKFPLESFERYLGAKDSEDKKKAKADFKKSVKARIDEIAGKYIRPHEGTFDFALMYIPSESVYYEILNNDNAKGYELFDYAMKSRVIPVSPNTFYAYMLSIVYGLKGLKIEEQAESIVKKIAGIQKSFRDLDEELATLGKHISNAGAKFSEVKEKAGTIGRQVENLSK